MRFSNESRNIRWLCLVATWLLVAILFVLHTLAMRDYVDMVGHLGLRGAPEATSPLIFDADSKMWIRHSLSLVEGNSIQLRHTNVDNAPTGRDVNWNSAWAWTIAGSGLVYRLFTTDSMLAAIEHAAMWLNIFIFMGLVLLFSLWTARRAGVVGGVVVALGMVGSDRFYEGFYPYCVDHHGLLTMSVFGLMLGVLFMGAGWWQLKDAGSVTCLLPESANMVRQAAIFSAVFGAVGMWISAASAFPPIVIIGLASLLTTLLKGRKFQKAGIQFEVNCWRIWGRTGAVLCLIFYAIEFAPSHLGMRLENNHPLYAIAWLGGGELVAEFSKRWLAGSGQRWVRPQQLLLPFLAVIATPVTILFWGQDVFVLLDPFIIGVHHDINEFLSPWKRGETFKNLDMHYVAFAVALVMLFIRKSTLNVVLWFSVIASIGFISMASWQSRWLLNASGPQICVTLVVLATLIQGRRPLVCWLFVIIAAGLIYLPPAVARITDLRVLTTNITPWMVDVREALYRDVAAVIRSSQPNGKIVLLSNPVASNSISYYGSFQTIGTFYWENADGLKTAAAIFSALSFSEAENLIRSHGITHIAMFPHDDTISFYYGLLHPDAPTEGLQKSFGYRLLVADQIPPWLKVLPFQMPDDLQSQLPQIVIFKVAP
jgi:hypothetical protein